MQGMACPRRGPRGTTTTYHHLAPRWNALENRLVARVVRVERGDRGRRLQHAQVQLGVPVEPCRVNDRHTGLCGTWGGHGAAVVVRNVRVEGQGPIGLCFFTSRLPRLQLSQNGPARRSVAQRERRQRTGDPRARHRAARHTHRHTVTRTQPLPPESTCACTRKVAPG